MYALYNVQKSQLLGYVIKSLLNYFKREHDSSFRLEVSGTCCKWAKHPGGDFTERAAVSRRAAPGRADANGLPSKKPSRRDGLQPTDKTIQRSSYPMCPTWAISDHLYHLMSDVMVPQKERRVGLLKKICGIAGKDILKELSIEKDIVEVLQLTYFSHVIQTENGKSLIYSFRWPSQRQTKEEVDGQYKRTLYSKHATQRAKDKLEKHCLKHGMLGSQGHCHRHFSIKSSQRWLQILFDRSNSFKVIDFCTNRKPECDFLLLIHCDLSSISPCFR